MRFPPLRSSPSSLSTRCQQLSLLAAPCRAFRPSSLGLSSPTALSLCAFDSIAACRLPLCSRPASGFSPAFRPLRPGSAVFFTRNHPWGSSFRGFPSPRAFRVSASFPSRPFCDPQGFAPSVSPYRWLSPRPLLSWNSLELLPAQWFCTSVVPHRRAS